MSQSYHKVRRTARKIHGAAVLSPDEVLKTETIALALKSSKPVPHPIIKDAFIMEGVTELATARWTGPLTTLGPILVAYISDTTGSPQIARADVPALFTGQTYSVSG